LVQLETAYRNTKERLTGALSRFEHIEISKSYDKSGNTESVTARDQVVIVHVS
jgi:hypothetical protein